MMAQRRGNRMLNNKTDSMARKLFIQKIYGTWKDKKEKVEDLILNRMEQRKNYHINLLDKSANY